MYTARWTCPAWPGHRMGPVYRYLRTWLLRAWRAGEHSLWPDVALAAALSLAAVWLTIHAADASGGERPLPLDVSPPAGQPPAPDAAGLPHRPVRRPTALRLSRQRGDPGGSGDRRLLAGGLRALGAAVDGHAAGRRRCHGGRQVQHLSAAARAGRR